MFVKLLFSSYEDKQVMISSGNVYLLQYGAYTNKELFNEINNTLEDTITFTINNNYYINLGVTTNYDIALKLKKIYEKENIYLYIKTNYLGNTDIIDKITQNDYKILNSKNDQEIKELIKINNNLYNLQK